MLHELASVVVWLAFILCSIIGFLGAVVPTIPGTPLIFVGTCLLAWWYNFTVIGIPTLITAAALAIFAMAIDIAASIIGAKRVGASNRAVIGASIGAFIGMFFLLPGIILGPFIGAVVGELSIQGGWAKATKVGIGTWLGMLVGAAGKLTISLAMVCIVVLQFL